VWSQIALADFLFSLVGAHDSVGGQPTQALNLDFVKAAEATGYKWAKSATTKDDIRARIKELLACEGPAMLELRVNKGARSNLGRCDSLRFATLLTLSHAGPRPPHFRTRMILWPSLKTKPEVFMHIQEHEPGFAD
jgi:hypothetical protein